MCKSGSSKAAKRQAREARRQEEARLKRIKTGQRSIDMAFRPYDDSFFEDRRQSYIDFANPQREENTRLAAFNLANSLARQGILESSTAVNKRRDLTEADSAMGREIASSALAYENQARASIQDAKQRLLEQNAAVADPGIAARMSSISARNAAALPTFDPVTNLAANVAQGLATQADLERRGMARYPDFFGGSGTPASTRTVR